MDGNRKQSPLIWILVAVVFLYLADAAYPAWDWNCTAQGPLGGMPSIPEVRDDPQMEGAIRHMNLTIPKGCEANPHNTLRRAFEWVSKWIS